MTAIILIALGSIFILSGIYIYPKAAVAPKISDSAKLESAIDTAISDGLLTKNEKDTIRRIAADTALDPEKAIVDAERKLLALNIRAEAEVIDPGKRSGDDFEKYIVKKFDHRYFKIKNWAGDKYVNGRYAETTPQPDLQMEFNMKGESHLFAVECKWRKNDRNEGFEFASAAQLERYRKFEAEKGIPVFIAIGMGGEGGAPEQLFIIPLKRLKFNFITLSYLNDFEKNKDKMFFFDQEKGILR